MSKMYAFYDKVSERYSVFDMAPSDAVAQRNFREWCQKFAQMHSDDLSLYRIGEFDEVSGDFLPDKVHLENGVKNE